MRESIRLWSKKPNVRYGNTGWRDLSATASVLSAASLGELTRLNVSYLTLLESLERSEEHRQERILGLERRYVGGLRGLGRIQHVQIASCPYVLFRLRLGRPGAAASVYESGTGDWPPRERAAQCRFVTSALLYAWHLARSDTLAARTTLGLSSGTCRAIGGLSVTHLHLIATKGPHLLTTRFVRYRPFWPDVIRAAAQGSCEQLAVGRLAGFQWMAMQDPD